MASAMDVESRINKQWVKTAAAAQWSSSNLVEDALALRDVPVPSISQPGQFLVQITVTTVDPYFVRFLGPTPMTLWRPDDGAFGVESVGVVVESSSDKFRVGDAVLGRFGWQQYALVESDSEDALQRWNVSKLVPTCASQTLKDLLQARPSLALGALGMPGATAYFGLLKLVAPRAGQNIVVSGAAGAVGGLVGQIAQTIGCRVFGIASSPAKAAYCVERLRFDGAVSYAGKSRDELREELAALLQPYGGGVDGYFDNTGGISTDAVFPLLNLRARVSVCGQIAHYHETPTAEVTTVPLLVTVLRKQVRVEGFMAGSFPDWSEAHEAIAAWLAAGELTADEDVSEGIENTRDAFFALFRGLNTGKKVVKF